MITLRPDGYFYKEASESSAADSSSAAPATRFIPVGVNYWPASCGTEMWTAWPQEEIQSDLRQIASLGLNSIRFFLRWDIFHPQADSCENAIAAVDDPAPESPWNRLRDFLRWCAEAGIYAQPTLFVGWMSGGLFWPEWKAGRNLFSAPECRQRSVEYARAAARVCGEFPEILLGIDLGNELCCIPDSLRASHADVVAWSLAVTDAIRRECPAWIINGNEQNQIVRDCEWRLAEPRATYGADCLSMHAYPIPSWHPVPFNGMADPLAQSLLPFYVKVARTFGPVMLQEFGAILTRSSDPAPQRGYLKNMLEAVLQAGANGFLYWCWSDFSCNQPPYSTGSFEKTLGLVDTQRRVKPGPDELLAFQKTVAKFAETGELPSAKQGGKPLPGCPSTARTEVGLYWPLRYYKEEVGSCNRPEHLAPRMILAHYLIGKAGFKTSIIRHEMLADWAETTSAKMENNPAKPSAKVIVITGALLTTDEITALHRWVKAGGRLLWNGPDFSIMGPEFTALTGFLPTDFGQPVRYRVGDWTLDTFPQNIRVEIERRGATIRQGAAGAPLVLEHALGQGRVTTFLPDVEGGILREIETERPAPEHRDRWAAWYAERICRLIPV